MQIMLAIWYINRTIPRTEKSAIFHWHVCAAFRDRVPRPEVGFLRLDQSLVGSSKGVCKFGRTKIEYADSVTAAPLTFTFSIVYLTTDGISKHSTACSTPSPSNAESLLLN